MKSCRPKKNTRRRETVVNDLEAKADAAIQQCSETPFINVPCLTNAVNITVCEKCDVCDGHDRRDGKNGPHYTVCKMYEMILKPTYTRFMKILAFTIVFLFGICSQTESTHTQEHASAHYIMNNESFCLCFVILMYLHY